MAVPLCNKCEFLFATALPEIGMSGICLFVFNLRRPSKHTVVIQCCFNLWFPHLFICSFLLNTSWIKFFRVLFVFILPDLLYEKYKMKGQSKRNPFFKIKPPKLKTTIFLWPISSSVKFLFSANLFPSSSELALIGLSSQRALLKSCLSLSPLNFRGAHAKVTSWILSSSKATALDAIGHFVELAFSAHYILCFQRSSPWSFWPSS